jgi:hypothetical protein
MSLSRRSSVFQRLTSLLSLPLVGVLSISRGLRFCVEQGIRGLETGVRPVPPSISESKLNMPEDGVQTLMPAMSVTFLRASASDGFKLDATFSEDGRLGLLCIDCLVGINVGVFS